jgi:hypothetical protein
MTIIAALVAFASLSLAQSLPPEEQGAIRVMVTMNTDGSRTEYKFDDARRKAVATTTNSDGKLREKIRYELDEMGRFSTGRVFGPDGKFRFKSRYKYDAAGRMQEETQMSEKNDVLHRIVYSYDSNGKATGYSILDGSGKVLSRTTAPTAAASPKPREKKSR